jgi:hypothetical protein
LVETVARRKDVCRVEREREREREREVREKEVIVGSKYR